MAKCNICFEENLKEPIFTPCIHGFCQDCMAKWLVEKKHRRVIPCPVCKFDIAAIAGIRDESELFSDEEGAIVEMMENIGNEEDHPPQPILRLDPGNAGVPAHFMPYIVVNGVDVPVMTYMSTPQRIIDLGRDNNTRSQLDAFRANMWQNNESPSGISDAFIRQFIQETLDNGGLLPALNPPLGFNRRNSNEPRNFFVRSQPTFRPSVVRNETMMPSLPNTSSTSSNTSSSNSSSPSEVEHQPTTLDKVMDIIKDRTR